MDLLSLSKILARELQLSARPAKSNQATTSFKGGVHRMWVEVVCAATGSSTGHLAALLAR